MNTSTSRRKSECVYNQFLALLIHGNQFMVCILLPTSSHQTQCFTSSTIAIDNIILIVHGSITPCHLDLLPVFREFITPITVDKIWELQPCSWQVLDTDRSWSRGISWPTHH